jgi:hypothetical protein
MHLEPKILVDSHPQQQQLDVVVVDVAALQW